jgi:tRNA 2-thiouridine synthesizing protein A
MLPVEVDLRVDVRGVCCPLPLIELTRAVQRLQPGQTLEIIGNDPVFESAVHNFCLNHGHAVLQAITHPDRNVQIVIKVGGLRT